MKARKRVRFGMPRYYRHGRVIELRPFKKRLVLILFLPWTARHSFGRDFCLPTATIRYEGRP